MLTRREVVTGGMFGAAATAAPGAAWASQEVSAQEVARIAASTSAMAAEIGRLRQAATPDGFAASVPRVRDQFAQFLRANGKFPEYCDVGVTVFQELYDWHVRFQQPLTSGRTPDGRYALVFQYTQMILRPESEPTYIGLPYDQR
ncbi:MAG: hypothetical protein AB7H88_16315 [Vicinamibacterales bacterium]